MDEDSGNGDGGTPRRRPKVSAKVSAKVSPKRRTRRKAGDGAVIQRGDGRWAGKLRQPDGSIRWFYGKDQRAVEERLAEALRITGAGLPLPDGKLTFGAWLQEWLAGLPVTGEQRKGLKPSTIDYYGRYVRAHLLRSEIAQKPLAKLEPADLERLYRRMTGDPAEGGLGLSSTSAHHLHAVVHRALAKAVRQGKIVRNVAELVDEDARPLVNHTEMRVLADADYDRFLEVVRGERLEALFVVAVREGPRQGEILGLHWRDVDLDGGSLAVTGSLQGARRSSLTIGEPKSRRSRRRLALFPETVEALRGHRARQIQERLRAGSMWVEQDLVFPNEFGGFLSTTTLTRALDGLLRRAGLPDVRFHDLRHSAATDWLKNGMHPKVASERLGHASVGITLDLYSHVTPTMQQDAVEEVARKRSARRQKGLPGEEFSR
jgi:integrase